MIYKKNIFYCLLFLIYMHKGFSQRDFSEPQAMGYNVILSGFIGGIGGMFNKNKKQTFWEAFYKNFLKGGLGGGVIYAAKTTLPVVSNHFDNAAGYWSNRALMNLGHSMVFNASRNEDLLQYYYWEVYGVNMRFKIKQGFSFKAKASLATILMVTTQVLVFKGKMDFLKTLKYNAYYFDYMEKYAGGAGGFAMRNMFYVDKKLKPLDFRKTVVHEVIHTYQFMDFTSLRNAAVPLTKKYIFKENSFMEKISNYVNFDLPYLFAPYSFGQEYDSSTVEAEANFYMDRVVE